MEDVEMRTAERAETRSSRIEKVIGADGVARLAAAKVALFGLGGVGGSCAEALVRGGVGSIAVVDGDVVQESNLNRQAIAFCSTVGRRKVDVARAMAADINPDARVVARCAFVLPGDVESLMGELASALDDVAPDDAAAHDAAPVPSGVDFIVDAIDTVSTKIELAAYAEAHGIPMVSSMGAANKTDPTAFRFADLYETQNCPLSRAMRKAARKRGVGGLRVLYSTERVDAQPGRENLGTMSYAPPIMGQMLAGDVICSLLGLRR